MSANELPAVQENQPRSLIQVIAQAVADPRCDVEKMRALFELQKDIEDRQRAQIAGSAMSRLQAEIPPMTKMGQAKNSKFAKYEDIMVVMRPLLDKYGFSISFDEVAATDKTITFVMDVTHEDGHVISKRLTVPIDVASKNREGVGIRPAIQDSGSTVSYARRFLLKMHFNIVETDEDTNGENRKPLTDDEAKDLETAAKDAYGPDFNRFLVYMHVGEVKEILKVDLKKAYVAIKAKTEDTAKKAK